MNTKQRPITTDGFSRAPVYKRRSISEYSYKRQDQAQISKIKTQEIKSEPKFNPQTKRLSIPADSLSKKLVRSKAHVINHPNNSTKKDNQKPALIKRNILNVSDFPIPKQKKANFRFIKTNKTRTALITAALILLITGAYVNITSYLTNKKVGKTIIAGQYITNNETNEEAGRPGQNSSISESQPTTGALKEYRVAPDLPKYLKIDNLGIWSRVKRVGVDENNEIGNPKNVFDTAWYEGSAKPGEPGAVFINGHVLGPTKGGVFVNLKNIKIGTTISIVKGDNTEIKYKVMATEKFDANNVDMGKVLRPYDPNRQGLNIMTCNGTYDSKNETFDKRFVVYAVQSN